MMQKLLALVLGVAVAGIAHAQAPAAPAPAAQQPSPAGSNFSGQTSTLETDGVVSIGRRLFEPGVHSNWHRHEGGQVVFAEKGAGFYQERGKPVHWLSEGQSGYIAANTPHWHGAVPKQSFTQLVVTFAGATTWMEKVTEEDYTRLIK
jgi:quercetin dioxygenase-like cupin family protein